MLFSGKNFRSIADQTGNYSYVFKVQPKNSSKIHLGLTGDYNLDYTFDGGKIFDRNSGFVDSYSKNKICVISGNSNGKLHEFFINGQPKIAGESIPSGKIYGFFSQNLEPESIDFRFYGQTPDYSIDQLSNELVSGEILTGRITNNNPFIGFNLFSGSVLSSDVPISLSGINSERVTGYKDFYIVPESARALTGDASLRFFTDFGEVDYSYSFSGAGEAFVPNPNFYLSLQPFGNRFNGEDGSSTLPATYSNPDGAQIKVSLSHISGQTGDVFVDKLFKKEVIIQKSGLVSGSGLFSTYETGTVSGIDASGLLQTGLGSGFLVGEASATGEITYDYQLTLTGLGSGIVNKDTILSTYSDERFSGEVPFGSTIIFKTITGVSGSGILNGFEVEGLIKTGVGSAAINTLDYLPTGQINLQESSYTEETLTEYMAYTGLVSKEYDLVGSGFAGPIIESGVFNQNFFANVKKGTYHFEKNFKQTTSDFDGFFLADTLDEVVLGEPREITGLEFELTGKINTSINGECLEKSPTLKINGNYFTNNSQILNSKALFSLYKKNPSFTGSILTVERSSDGQEKDIYFYKNYVNIENIKHFAGSGDVFVTKWRDQSINDLTFIPQSGLPRILTGNKEFNSGIIFREDWLDTENLLEFGPEEYPTILFSGASDWSGYSSGLFDPNEDIQPLAFNTGNDDWIMGLINEDIPFSNSVCESIYSTTGDPLYTTLPITGGVYIDGNISDVFISEIRVLNDDDCG